MEKGGIVFLGFSAAAWSSVFVYRIAREPPWLLMLVFVALYGGWTIQTLLHCKCGQGQGTQATQRQ
jgi:hypothetical protein